MDWYTSVFEVIDMRSFSNLWYWIVLAVTWSSTSHWVLGVPFDLIQRAGRHGGQAEADLQDLVRINANRILLVTGVSGVWVLGLASFCLTVLAVLGFYYWIEFCQAVFLLALPLSLVGGLRILVAQRIRRESLAGESLRKRLMLHRLHTQIVGMLAIFVTGMWGMWQNLAIGALGG